MEASATPRSALQPPPKRPKGLYPLQRGLVLAFRGFFHCVKWAATQRKKHHIIFHFIVAAITIPAAVLVSVRLKPVVGHYLNLDENTLDFYAGVVHVTVGALLATIGSLFLSLILPFVLIAQRVVALDSMGFEWASIEGDIHHQLGWYLDSHPPKERIKVICISGRSLFRDPLNGAEAPLRKWLHSELLDVVMPVSDATNPTVTERFRTYSKQFREQHYTNGITDLVNEMDKGKALLRKFAENTLVEHDAICMWRVIILKDYCLVQNYFPNADGDESDNAPLFVYKRGGTESYYETFLEMFNLLSQYPKRPTAAPAAGT